jgi:glycosyltransferase involved in cell wall biosynthesis
VSAPLVTVYLPTRDRAALLRDAAASVLAQTMPDLELVIVEDASADDTAAVVAELARRDPRVRAFRQDEPRGAPAARNRALAEARGRFITGLDDDDLMLPARLERLLAAQDERHAFTCSAFLHERDGWRRPVFAHAREITLEALLHYNLVGNQALMLTERLRAVGGFDEALVASQDYDLWTRLVARYGPALRIAEPTYVFRERAAATSISGSPRAGEGAAQYAQKHAPLMNAAQRRSQRLIQAIAAGRRLGLSDLPGCFALPTAGVLARYWLAGMPLARAVQSRYRRQRWAAGREA